jgi:hypothetical protein
MTLIKSRCDELSLNKARVVRLVGYENEAKGIRRLDALMAGDLETTRTLIHGLSAALDLPDEVVHHAVQETRQQLDDRKRRQWEAEEIEWRASFRPHAILLTERTVPSPMFVAAVISVERILRVNFHANAKPISFVKLALDGVKQKTAKWGNALPGFGRPIGIVVNYAPDNSVRFDLDGKPREIFCEAYRVGHVHILTKGRPVPAGVLRVAGLMMQHSV